MFLEEGDVAEIRRKSIHIVDAAGARAARAIRESDLPADAVERGQYRHFMLKEIHEQPRAIAQTLEERIAGGKLLDAAFGPSAQQVFKQGQGRAYCGLRHQLPRGPGRQLSSSSKSAASRRGSKSPANTATAIR